MSGAIEVKDEKDSIQIIKTFLKEIGTTKLSWIAANLHDFYQLNKKVVSPELKVKTGSNIVSFHLELEMIQSLTETDHINFTVFMVKHSGSSVTVHTEVAGNRMKVSTTFMIGANEQKEIWKNVQWAPPSRQGYKGKGHQTCPQTEELALKLDISILEVGHQCD